MAKKDSNKDVNKKTYKKPAETLWGKILVWALIVGMVGAVLVGTIVSIVEVLK